MSSKSWAKKLKALAQFKERGVTVNERARITIVLLENGNISVNAPTDKILSFGMLELAKYLIATKQAAPSQLVQPAIVIPKVGMG